MKIHATSATSYSLIDGEIDASVLNATIITTTYFPTANHRFPNEKAAATACKYHEYHDLRN